MSGEDDLEIPEKPSGEPDAGPDPSPAPEPGPAPARRRWRWKLDLGMSAVTVLVTVAMLAIGLYYWASSPAFEDSVRRRVVAALQEATGGRVEIAAFRWDLIHLRIEATGITIHGTEAAKEAPYAHVERLRAQISVLNLLTIGQPTKVILREAEVLKPEFHLIVYPDGSTNQPHPRHPRPAGKPVMDTLFDAQIGRLWVQQGTAHIADAVVPLDLEARDADLKLSWVPDPSAPEASGQGSYRILAGLGELAFAQKGFKPVASRIDASLLLLHNGLELDSLRIAALGQTLTLRGRLDDFARPSWQAQVQGQLDLRILTPYAGLAYVRSGVAGVNASVSGKGAAFEGAGDLASNAIHYQDPTVDAQTGRFSAHFHADPLRLLVSAVRVRIAQGGEVDGEFQYDNWLSSTPKPAARLALERAHQTWPVPTARVKANLQGITLDTILRMLATPPYRNLGLGTTFSGPATAEWTGLAADLTIGGQLAFAPTGTLAAGQVPVNGSMDATFHSETGSIKVRTLDVRLPRSTLEGQGSLGVYPIDRASEMDLDFTSSDLAEFDGVLRTLNLTQGNRVGAAALPVALNGQAQFHGQLNSSWLTPRVEGRVKATDIGIEIPDATESAANPNAALKFLHWDSIDVDGLYTPATIVVRRGILRRGTAGLTLEGHLDAADPAFKIGNAEDEFDAHSMLTLKASAAHFPIEELLPLAGFAAPVTGALSAQVDVRGPIDGLSGTGSVDLDKATVYGESVSHVHATGSVGGQQVKLTTLAVEQSPGSKGGRISASGSLDLGKRSFQLDARGSAIDLAGLEHWNQTGVALTGNLAFTVLGDGPLADPHLVSRATFSNMNIGGAPVSDLLVSATTQRHEAAYDLSSHQPAGDFSAHGVTRFNSDYYTQASLQFARFDIGALLKLLHVTGITGQSALEGTANISGPLTHPEKIRGEASLNQLAVDVEGVHLTSKGPVHASLVEGVARLDPLEITGEDTDLKLHGSLAIAGARQLDLGANGSVNLRLAETLDPDLTASGVTNFQMEAHGPLANPLLQGKVEFQNDSIALQDFPNGLSQINGTLEFMQNRLEVRSLTAMSGGGQLSVAGYLGFQQGLYADLSATGKAIRIRYPQGISSLADATLRLQGPQNNLMLSGNVLVTRFAINSDLDIGALASQANAVVPVVAADAPSNHLRLDIHLRTAPQLNFQNAYAKLAGDAELNLRGTLASPSLLGRISLTEGSTSIGGTKYELQRGDIVFNNPVRIEPNIDIDATARVEDYDITLGLHGSAQKPRLTYRSEPPLPEADIVALLALGRTADEQSAYTQQQQQAGDNPMTDALLGGALNATVSNRVQRIFGTGAVKVDPNFIGSLGNSTARVTVVEQIGNNVTFTYASNVNTTTQQLIQAEIAINRHVSLLVTQDESGIFSVVVKARRRFD